MDGKNDGLSSIDVILNSLIVFLYRFPLYITVLLEFVGLYDIIEPYYEVSCYTRVFISGIKPFLKLKHPHTVYHAGMCKSIKSSYMLYVTSLHIYIIY